MKKALVLLLCTLLMVTCTLTALAASDILDFSFAQNVGYFSEGTAVFKAQSGLCGYVNSEGQIAIAPQFVMAQPFSEGMALVDNGVYYGYIDATGTMVIDYQYKDATDFSEGLAAVRLQDDTWAYIDKTGAMVISLAAYEFDSYSDPGAFNGGVAELSTRSYGTVYIDKTGAATEAPAASAMPITFEKLDFYYPTYQLYNNGAPAGIIEYDSTYAGLYEEEIVPVQGADGLYVIDRDWLFDASTNRILLRDMYGISTVCEEGRILVSNTNGNYFVDVNGRMQSPLVYGAYDFSCGYAVIQVDNGRYGAYTLENGYYFITPNGDLASRRYEKATPFADGLAIVRIDGVWHVMDSEFNLRN